MPAEAIAADGFVLSADGARIAYRGWPLADAKVTFAVVHGHGEHSGRYAAFASAMAARGMATYAVDLRGHGRSEGQRGHVDSWTQWIEDVAAFVHRVQTATAGEVVPLGHSFGGVALLSTVLARRLSNVRRFVLSSPALKVKVTVPQWKITMGDVASRIAPRLAFENEVDAGTLSRIPEVVSAYRTDPLVHSKISSRLFTEYRRATAHILEHADEIDVPFLILAGTDDELVDSAGSEQLHLRSQKMSTLRLLSGRFHEPFNDLGSEEVFDVIQAWLKPG